jgi:hypothetical protein
MSRKLCALVATGILSSGLFTASSALGAPTLSLGTAADPAESITTQITATGVSTNNQTVLRATLKSTGGQACGANYQADQGSTVIGELGSLEEGPFSRSVNYTFTDAGSYLLCGWLNDTSQAGDPVVASASLTLSVRPPHLALSISAPAIVATGQAFQISTTAQAEVSRTVKEYVLPNTGRGCPANQAAAGTTSGSLPVNWPTHFSGWSVNGGPFTESANVTLQSAGQFLVCAYVQYLSEQSPPEISANAAITAVSPPPPCIVPTFSAVTKLRSAEQAIRISGCAVGKIRRIPNRRVRAGYVIGFSSAPGTRLPPGSAVVITLSTGPPCIVPHVSAGTALGTVERRLIANHCAVGKISSARSRRIHRGRVLRLGVRTGRVLPSHAPIAIVIAKRRR